MRSSNHAVVSPRRIHTKKFLLRSLTAILFALGLLLLYLTNAGLVSFDEPYIRRVSRELVAKPHSAATTIAFVDVNVIPLDRERVLPHQTVVVRDGVIATMSDSSRVAVPIGALEIEGAGKYLMPGLVDMHVHIQGENDLLLLVANGVTTARNMWGNTDLNLRLGLPDQLELREQIKRGEVFGKHLLNFGAL